MKALTTRYPKKDTASRCSKARILAVMDMFLLVLLPGCANPVGVRAMVVRFEVAISEESSFAWVMFGHRF